MQAHELAQHICLAAQPKTVNGSPDTLIVRGVDGMLGATELLAEAIVRAVSGKTSAKAIAAAATAAGKRFGAGPIAKPIERELLHGAMLGALDAAFEADTDQAVAVERFSFHDTSFAGRPIKEAIAKFLSKKAVTREVFDLMEEQAKRRAFTVAGMANAEMVSTVKRELIRQVAIGADLREFGKNAAKRFEQAGWVPANASHVETIFRTNVLGSYSGGRIRQMSQPEVLDVRPFWQILTANDGPPRQRPTHQAAHLVVLRASDPFWQRCCSPFGYNCRCRQRSLSIRQGAPLVREGTSIHGLPDPGFASGIGSLFEAGLGPEMPRPAND